MIVPIPFFNFGAGLGKNTLLSILILFNILLLIFGVIVYNIYLNDNYLGSFWQWSWDTVYFLKVGVENTHAGDIAPLFWIALFLIDGMALFVLATEWIEKFLDKLNSNNERL